MSQISSSIRFQQPPPYTADGYLDHITSDKLRNPRQLVFGSTQPFYHALQEIGARPLPERLFLFNTLEQRIVNYGDRYTAKSKKIPLSAQEYTEKVILEKVFGQKKSAGDKIYEKLSELFTDFIKSGLNSRGKSMLHFLQVYWDIVSAKTTEDADKAIKAALNAVGNTVASAWIKSNWPTVLQKIGRVTGAPKYFVNRIEKRIVVICASYGRFSAFVGRLSPWLFPIEILFTPEDIADDEKQSIAFLLAQIQNARASALSNIVTELSRGAWITKVPTDALIRRAIIEAR